MRAQTSVYGIKSQQKNNLPQFYEEIISHFKAETCLKPQSVILSGCQTWSHSQGIYENEYSPAEARERDSSEKVNIKQITQRCLSATEMNLITIGWPGTQLTYRTPWKPSPWWDLLSMVTKGEERKTEMRRVHCWHQLTSAALLTGTQYSHCGVSMNLTHGGPVILVGGCEALINVNDNAEDYYWFLAVFIVCLQLFVVGSNKKLTSIVGWSPLWERDVMWSECDNIHVHILKAGAVAHLAILIHRLLREVTNVTLTFSTITGFTESPISTQRDLTLDGITHPSILNILNLQFFSWMCIFLCIQGDATIHVQLITGQSLALILKVQLLLTSSDSSRLGSVFPSLLRCDTVELHSSPRVKTLHCCLIYSKLNY